MFLLVFVIHGVMLYIVYYSELLEPGVQKMNCLDPATKHSEESLLPYISDFLWLIGHHAL